MIGEILNEKNVIIYNGELNQNPLEFIRDQTLHFEGKEKAFRELLKSVEEPFYFLPEGIFVPHVRISGLSGIHIQLAIFQDGIQIGGKKIHTVMILISPENQPTLHLQYLQGLSSLLPSIQEMMIHAKTPEEVIHIVKAGEKNSEISYKNITQKQIEFELHTSAESGLSQKNADDRLRYYGKNEIKREAKKPWYWKLLKNFFSFFAVLLWIAALMCYIPGVDMPELGTAILIVVFMNGIFAFLQEYKSDRAVEALRNMMAKKSRVIRDGKLVEINAENLVPGDLISLEEGDMVPADARIVEAYEVEVDNSSLTGESTSTKRYKSDQDVLIRGKFLWIELPNIVFAGSVLIRGSSKAIVFGTGMNSEIGKIAGMTQEIKAADSPLQKELKRTVYIISVFAFTIGIIFLSLGWMFAGLSFVQAFIFFIGIFVANVPEGLLPTVTLALAMGVSRMAKRNAIVKNLTSVETLGCTTVICTDKTGTLTENIMQATEVMAGGTTLKISGNGYDPNGDFFLKEEKVSAEKIAEFVVFRELFACAFHCNNAKIDKTNKEVSMIGDPTEGALLAMALRAGYRGAAQRIHQNLFESIRKRMSVIIHSGKKKAYIKGAPDEILKRCSSILTENGVSSLSTEQMEEIKLKNDESASRGLRVLAFAYRELPDDFQDYTSENLEQEMVYIGTAGLTDPVREKVPKAIQDCHTAGIRVIMITGDYALTAKTIGEAIGLGKDGLQVLSGPELINMPDSSLREILKVGEFIFARVSPEQKLRIVALLQELGEIVAVTGDGVNDGPALKKADIGIAMGLRGTDVAKEAAEIVLTDDNFASIVAAVEEGRAIFENIKKFSAYILNSNPQEMIPFLLWVLIPGFPLVMTVMGVLAVDVGTDLLPAMGLGIEPPEKGIMEKPPRKTSDRLLSLSFVLKSYFVQGGILAFSCFLTYFYFVYSMGNFQDGFSLSTLPANPPGLDMKQSSFFYLQSLAAFFIPTVAVQIANVLCKRSWKTSLFSKEFMSEGSRESFLNKIHSWKIPTWSYEVKIEYKIHSINRSESLRLLGSLLLELILFPFRILKLIVTNFSKPLNGYIVHPLRNTIIILLERFPFLVNLISNPLIVAGILFEIALTYAFFYTDLKSIYYFEPPPLSVYFFALHGTFLLILFEELKKYFRRKGYPLEWMG